jgi:hypothetical protein
MSIISVLHDKDKKAVEKRVLLVEGIRKNTLSIEDVTALADMTEKDTGIVLEAMEEVSRTEPTFSSTVWLSFAEKYIEADNNTLKREASRAIGNIASLYPDELDGIVSKLLANSSNDGTVVRWGSAYALGRIILIPRYAKSDLYEKLTAIAEAEQENGVRNQYVSGLKKAQKLRTD